jgi:ADP-ribosylglycohydrolase
MTKTDQELTATPLFDRIYAAMVAGAIGDAMGGPVEGWTYQRIQETYGIVDDLLPYEFAPDYHNHFRTAPGSVTDDTRLKHLVAGAMVADGSPCWRGALPRRGDIAWAIVQAYHAAETSLERGFLEEYALGGVYGEAKLIWGGRMTNGFSMANAPLGLICPGDPETAFALSFDVDFISDGYAKYSAAIGAATVAAALAPGSTPASIVEQALAAAQAHRVEGSLTQAWQWYDHVFTLNERLVTTAVDLALRHRDVFAVREAYYEQLRVSELGSEAAQTLAVALGMLVAADGDLRQAIIGCVNYGRDNDSYATLVGAITGAMHGLSAVPESWRRTVEAANPEFDMRATSLKLTQVVQARYQRYRSSVRAMRLLLGG